jgi:hypothetical protein
MPMLPVEFQPVYDSFARGEISFQEMQSKGAELGVTIAAYDPVNGRNPIYSEGNNNSRVGFTYGLRSAKGKTFQHVLKPAIIKIIDKMHKWIVGEWDSAAYEYDDPRMKVLDMNVHNYIDDTFDHEDRKLDFMHKIADIGLFLLKEDIYYRARAFDMCNKLPYFVLSTHEVENIKTFTRGIGTADQFTMEPVVKHDLPPIERRYAQC